MGAFLEPILELVITVLDIYWWIVIVSVLMSWLLTFGVLTTANHVVRGVVDILYRLTEPVYRPFRRFVPSIGGLDIAPLIVLLIIWLIRRELIVFATRLL